MFPNSAPDSLTPNHWKTLDAEALVGKAAVEVSFGTEILLDVAMVLNGMDVEVLLLLRALL